MTSSDMERRLAAVLAADVVGFSRLVGIDEETTIARLAALRENVVDPAVSKFGGRIFKTTGDGFLIEFASVVDAMRCAVDIQRGMAGSGSGPEGIELRIGVNLGDVIVQGDDILGDGVNVAARLEGLADPGGICIPGKVFQEVHNKLDVGFEFAGERKVKNIETAIPTYRVMLDPGMAGKVIERSSSRIRDWRWLAAAAIAVAAIAAAVAWLQPWRGSGSPGLDTAGLTEQNVQSIAVLPFHNMSGDSEQAYFADGIAEDIITDLSRIADLFVIARNTSFQYRGDALNLVEIGRKLKVRYILEGSVRRSGEQVRVNAQLIDAATGGHIWAERYDGAMANVFSVQDQVTERIIEALKLKLTPAERKAVETVGTENAEAYDAYLHGLELLAGRRRYDHDANAQAQTMLKRAIDADPQYALATAGLAWAKYLRTTTIHHDMDDSIVFELAQRSIELSDNALARRVMSRKHFSLFGFDWVGTTRRVEKAREDLERAHELQPNDPDVLIDLAIALCFAGDPERAIELVAKAKELNPGHPDWYYSASGIARLVTGDPEGAVRDLSKWSLEDPKFHRPHLFLAAALALANRTEAAKASLARYFDMYHLGLRSLEAVRNKWPMAPEHEEILINGLRLAGMK